MPNSEHRKKTHEQSLQRNAANRAKRSALRTAVKSARTAADSGDAGKAGPAIDAAYASLDKAAKSNLIHPNKAARMKSRLAKARNAAAQ